MNEYTEPGHMYKAWLITKKTQQFFFGIVEYTIFFRVLERPNRFSLFSVFMSVSVYYVCVYVCFVPLKSTTQVKLMNSLPVDLCSQIFNRVVGNQFKVRGYADVDAVASLLRLSLISQV